MTSDRQEHSLETSIRVAGLVLACLAVTVLLPCSGRAQEQTTGQIPAGQAAMPLSLDDAVSRGLALGEETQISSSRIVDAQQQIRIARSAAWPQLSSQVSYGRTIYTPFDFSSFQLPPGVEFPFGQKNTWNAGVTVNQSIYNGGIIRSGINIANLGAAIAGYRDVEDRAQVELDIIEAYYGAVLAEQSAEIIEATEAQLDAQLNHVRLLNKAGNSSDLEVLRVTVLRENIEPDRIGVLNARDLALLNLKRLINIPTEVTLQLTNGLAIGSLRRLDSAEIDKILDNSAERRGVVLAAERGVAILAEQVRIAEAAFLPSLDFSLRLNEQALPIDVIAKPSDYKKDWSAALGLNWALFDAGRRRAQVASAKEQLLQASLQLTQLREGVKLQLVQEREELNRAASLIDARQSTTKQAAKVYELTNASYDQGYATNLLLDDARLSLRQARLNEAQAVYAYIVALARLQFAAGAPLSVPAVPAPTTSREETPAEGTTAPVAVVTPAQRNEQ